MNILQEIFELTRHKKGCVASPIDRLNTEKDAVMSMSATSINKGLFNNIKKHLYIRINYSFLFFTLLFVIYDLSFILPLF